MSSGCLPLQRLALGLVEQGNVVQGHTTQKFNKKRKALGTDMIMILEPKPDIE